MSYTTPYRGINGARRRENDESYGPEEALIVRRIACGEQCPECSSATTESNGSSEYRCVACDHRWGFEGDERYGF